METPELFTEKELSVSVLFFKRRCTHMMVLRSLLFTVRFGLLKRSVIFGDILKKRAAHHGCAEVDPEAHQTSCKVLRQLTARASGLKARSLGISRSSC